MTPPAYFQLSDVKAYMPNNEVSNTTKWDGLVTTLTTNMSRAFDTYTSRAAGAYLVTADSTRYYNGVNPNATDYTTNLLIAELAGTPTSISIANSSYQYTPMLSTDYFMWPDNAALDGYPYWRVDLNPNGQTTAWPWMRRAVQVVGKFGYSQAVPSDVFEALLLLAVKYVRKAQQNYLKTGTVLDVAQIMGGMDVDPDIAGLILYYRHEPLFNPDLGYAP